MAPIAASLLACSAADPSVTSRPTEIVPSESPSPSPLTFESARHGYRVQVPPEWDLTEYGGTWIRLEQFSAGAEVPGEDVVLSPDGASFLVVNSMAIPEGMTAAEWRAAFQARLSAGLDPNCPGETSRGAFLDEPATVVTQPCEGSVIIGRSLTHQDRGYYFTIRFPEGDPDTEATVDGLVASIRFVEP